MAEEDGLDPDQYETWFDLAEAIRLKRTKKAGVGGKAKATPKKEEPEESVPEVGEVWYYKPPKSKKRVEVEVKAVFAGKKTANVKNIDDGKMFKAVPWSELSES
jgi:hypothetical protein